MEPREHPSNREGRLLLKLVVEQTSMNSILGLVNVEEDYN
jgi:hypothetical protein